MISGGPNSNSDMMNAGRSPESGKPHRGRLKVFFGMSAGVGKTYSMLEEARKRTAEGIDVLIGYAEPHIRPETESLLLGMNILPYKFIDHRGVKLKEFDLDAALARRPAIVCVDELAHTNAPELRHPKRWQDVAELLDSGISVYTTLNVQHLEGFRDIVERITGIRVQETLPDSVLEQADEVELVDISPDELLERIREGKVYAPGLAERALKGFFTKGNLIALRELALRKTAERVDAQMQDYRRDEQVGRVIPASERILVCVGPSPLSARLVRSARQLAVGLRAQLIAAYVETPAAASMGEKSRRRLEENLRLAEELGAKTLILSGGNVAEEVLTYALAHNVTKIVVGKPVRSRWRDMLFGSIVDDLVRRSGEIDVYVIRGESDAGSRAGLLSRGSLRSNTWTGWVQAVAIVAVTTAIGWPLYHSARFHIANVNILMLYLLGVLWVATHYGRSVAVLASILSVVAFDLVFVEPYYTLLVADRQYMVTFAVMLLTALIISELTHRVRAHAHSARLREERTAALLEITRDLSSAGTVRDIVAATQRQVAQTVGGRAMLLLANKNNRLDVPEAADRLSDQELAVAKWAFEHSQAAGRGTSTLPGATGTFFPLRAPRGIVGTIGVIRDRGSDTWSVEQRLLVEALASQAALAIERANLADEARAAWEHAEEEFLRNTLLSGVSHDLRTPLAAITGIASTLIETGDRIAPPARSEMLETIFGEAERMERLVKNLLEMTRLESGGLRLNRNWQHLQEVVGATLHHLDKRLAGRKVHTSIPSDLPLVYIDDVAMEHVLNNLLENAIAFSPANSEIGIIAHATGPEIVVEVSDHGPGLLPGTEQKIFEKFFRAPGTTSNGHHGIGLGLAICRGIVEAHSGRISAANRPGGGAIFTFTLPLSGLSSRAAPAIDQHG